MNSKDHTRRQELRSLVDSCCRDVSSDCLSSHSLGQQCDAWSELMACDAKIAQMEEELINIYRSRFLLKEEVNRSHDKLLRKIPTEVVSSIFDFCVNETDGDFAGPFDTMANIDSSPLTLTRVCKVWRDFVCTVPRLWATLRIRITYTWFSAQLFRTWSIRSGEVPLSITLYFDDDVIRNIPDPNPFLGMIEGCAYRCHRLAIGIQNNNICEVFFQHQALKDLVQLDALQVQLYGKSVGPNLKNFLQHTSRLKHFEISSLISLSDVDIRWSALTRLKIDEISWSVFFQILRLASGLVQCEMGMRRAIQITMNTYSDLDFVIPTNITDRLPVMPTS